jgi:hypothetical protein
MTDPEDEDKPKRSFKVEDRRRFSETGEARPSEDEAASAPSPEPRPEAAAVAGSEKPDTQGAAPLEMNFSTFVISLSTQALAHLGEITDPIEGRIAVDLTAAKQLIDILGILKDKSKGNLDEAENALLEHCLYDLRLKYVELVRRRQSLSESS